MEEIPDLDTGIFTEAIEGVRQVVRQREAENGWIFRSEFVGAPLMMAEGSHLSQHRRNVFRYMCDTFPERVPAALRSAMRAIIPHHYVWRQRTPPPTKACPRHLHDTDEPFYIRLAFLYRRVIRRWRKTLRRGSRIVSIARSDDNALIDTEEWTYLLTRAWWENVSVWSLSDDPPKVNAHPILAAQLGARIHAVGSPLFRFIPLAFSPVETEDAIWANLHAWIVLFAVIRDAIRRSLRSGVAEDRTLSMLQNFDADDAPMLMLRARKRGDDRIELHIWPNVGEGTSVGVCLATERPPQSGAASRGCAPCNATISPQLASPKPSMRPQA
jgi:hypothetical protein